MTTVLLFARLTDPGVADVRAALRDWAAAGLVAPPLWIDVDQPADPRRPVTGWESTPVGESAVNVSGWFAAHHVAASGEGVRLVCLQVLPDASRTVGFHAVALLRERLNLPGLQLVNVLAPAAGLSGLADDALFDSQRNVLLQPVDTEDPAGQGFTVGPGSAAALHTAAGLATVAGLWTAVGDAPNDRDHPWPGRQVRVARSYLRYLDGTEVLDGIAEAVLDENGGRPTSRTPQGQMFTTVGPGARVATAESVADSLVGSQAVALYHPLPPPPRPARKQIKAGAALRDFFSFLGGALASAPGQWVTRRVENFQTGVASRLTSALYGEEGAFEVVLGNRPGSVPDAQAAADGARWLMAKLAPAGSEPPSPEAHALWRGEVTLAVALLDGSPTTLAELPSRGTQRLLLGDPAAVAPAPGTEPFAVPAGLLRSQAPVRIAPDDPYTARRVLTELGEAQQQSAAQGWSDQGWGGGGWPSGGAFGSGGPGRQGAQAGLVAGQLRQWMEQRRSFTYQVSDRIAQGLLAAQADQLALLNASTGEEIASARSAAQQEAGRTRSRLLAWFGGLLLAVLVIVALVVLVKIPVWLIVVLVVLVLLGWLAGALWTFVRSSQRYYQLIHALDTLAARRAWADDHALSVPQAVTRLADVYRRSRQWAAVIGELVHDPFCRDARSAGASTPSVRLTGTLPYGMALGHLPFDPESYRSEVFRAAAITLQPGWLDTTEAARRVLALSVRSRQSGVREHETVFNSDGTEHSALAALVDAQRQPEFRRAQAAGAVSWLTGKLQSGGFDLQQAVLDAGGSLRPVHASEFVQQLVDAVPVPAQEGMSAAGVQHGAADVATTHLWGVPGRTNTEVSEPSSQPGGVSVRRIVLHPSAPPAGRRLLDRLVVRCDMTRGLEAGELSYFASSATTAVESSPVLPDDQGQAPAFRTRA